MKNLLATVAACALLLPCAARAVSDEPGYPTMQDVYNDCRQSVMDAQTNPQSFLQTRCAAEISGFWSGYLSVANAVAFDSTSTDPCEQKLVEANESFKNTNCIPDGWQDLDVPLELKVATELLVYLEGKGYEYPGVKEAPMVPNAIGQLRTAIQHVTLCKRYGDKGKSDHAKAMTFPSLQALYDDCAAVVADERNFAKSRCYRFVSGFWNGSMTLSWRIPPKAPPCTADYLFAELGKRRASTECPPERQPKEWREFRQQLHDAHGKKLVWLFARTFVAWAGNHPVDFQAAEPSAPGRFDTLFGMQQSCAPHIN